ncbi:VWA domain-containing protein [Leptospira wolffii]|uniref:anti-sigma factor antagonist n=1 Tax=Leptospira wolffii TaxID=409998 RepID=UPI001082CB5F|nr:anti-sigma factor antagonist [Leptospira wolffii]TGK61840.1 VWA domain-containing protein [Leptospira wolffii]TGK65927.1 VWA domain-containing protein [Leptospira wolffii]TGK74776.1 VWA domain-containing protein [Leptospira wolffii]TGL30842.1 VWA domain-containing protein [Leptospira wolffii]
MILSAKLQRPAGSSAKTNTLLIRLNSPTISNTAQRQPLVLGLALDRSWSMKGDKMDAVVQASASMVNWLTRRDFLTAVAYAEDVQVIQPLVPLAEKNSVIHRLNSIQVGTSTNLSGGWLHVLRTLELHPVVEGYKRVILLTDGNPTLGIKDPVQLIQIAADAYKKGISTTVIGFGNDFNEILLKEIAESGGGNFYYVETPEETGDIFFKEFGDIGTLYAQSIELKVELPQGMDYLDLVSEISSYTEPDPEETGRVKNLVLEVGDMRADDVKSVVVHLRPSKKALPENIKISASYYELTDGAKLEQKSFDLPLDWSDDSGKEDADVVVESTIARTGKGLRKAGTLLKEGYTDESVSLLNELIKEINEKEELAPEVLQTLGFRVSSLKNRILENSPTAAKHLVASASELQYGATESFPDDGVEYHDEIYTFHSTEDIDLYKCPEIKSAIQAKMREGYRYIIFNLGKSSYIDSSAIGMLIQIAGWLRKRGGELVVSNLKASVKKVFSITRLESHIRSSETEDDARSLLKTWIENKAL